MHYVILVIFLFSAHVATACMKDTDCKGERICVVDSGAERGRCRASSDERTPMGADDGSSDQKSSDNASPKDPNSKMRSDTLKLGESRSFHANVLGVLQFGVTPTIEWGTLSTILLRGRLMNTGVLSYAVAAAEDEDFVFGLGVSGLWRRYLGKIPQSGPYFGAGAELMYTQSQYGDETYSTLFLVPQLEGGLRWNHDTYFTAAGAFMGVAIPIQSSGYDAEDAHTYVTGGLSWDIGWYF